jgi:hypothetical protein
MDEEAALAALASASSSLSLSSPVRMLLAQSRVAASHAAAASAAVTALHSQLESSQRALADLLCERIRVLEDTLNSGSARLEERAMRLAEDDTATVSAERPRPLQLAQLSASGWCVPMQRSSPRSAQYTPESDIWPADGEQPREGSGEPASVVQRAPAVSHVTVASQTNVTFSSAIATDVPFGPLSPLSPLSPLPARRMAHLPIRGVRLPIPPNSRVFNTIRRHFPSASSTASVSHTDCDSRSRANSSDSRLRLRPLSLSLPRPLRQCWGPRSGSAASVVADAERLSFPSPSPEPLVIHLGGGAPSGPGLRMPILPPLQLRAACTSDELDAGAGSSSQGTVILQPCRSAGALSDFERLVAEVESELDAMAETEATAAAAAALAAAAAGEQSEGSGSVSSTEMDCLLESLALPAPPCPPLVPLPIVAAAVSNPTHSLRSDLSTAAGWFSNAARARCMDALDRLTMLASQQQQQQHGLSGDSDSSSRLSSAEWPQLGSITPPPPLQQQLEWAAEEEAEDADFDESKSDCEPLASAAEIEAAGIEEVCDGCGDECSDGYGDSGDGDWWRCVPRVELIAPGCVAVITALSHPMFACRHVVLQFIQSHRSPPTASRPSAVALVLKVRVCSLQTNHSRPLLLHPRCNPLPVFPPAARSVWCRRCWLKYCNIRRATSSACALRWTQSTTRSYNRTSMVRITIAGTRHFGGSHAVDRDAR